MAEDKTSGDKTELPTARRLRDARRKGDVARSKEIVPTVATLVWLLLIIAAAGFAARQVAAFGDHALALSSARDFPAAAVALGNEAVKLLIVLSAMLLVPVAAVSTLAEALQIGPVFTTEKIKPSLDKLNPAEGFKRMFSKDALAELIKTLAKALLVVLIVWLILRSALPHAGELIALAGHSPLETNGAPAAQATLAVMAALTIRLFGWTVAAFVFVAAVDRVWSRHRFIRKMMMSRRDIRQEFKNDEGDPHVRQHRRQLHQEWANSNAVGAARNAAALLVNPTHIAIALDYDTRDCPVPVIAAKATGPLAAAMRAEAERAQVPIVRNIAAARRLWARGEVGEIVPEDMFDAIAEVILWAQRARAGQAPMVQTIDGDGAADLPRAAAG